MAELVTSFDDAWRGFLARDALLIAEGAIGPEWAQGRAQLLAVLARVEDPRARAHVAGVIEGLADIPGVEPYPEWYWHATVKAAGFQVIKRTRDDDILRQDVPRLIGQARLCLAREPAFEAQI
ncbi:MAG: hypothetical protein Q8S13_09610, partial [Dehalococcoidia bacterium]|nr:hypothetical protein [Dehalococcoidia bacterium]